MAKSRNLCHLPSSATWWCMRLHGQTLVSVHLPHLLFLPGIPVAALFCRVPGRIPVPQLLILTRPAPWHRRGQADWRQASSSHVQLWQRARTRSESGPRESLRAWALASGSLEIGWLVGGKESLAGGVGLWGEPVSTGSSFTTLVWGCLQLELACLWRPHLVLLCVAYEVQVSTENGRCLLCSFHSKE